MKFRITNFLIFTFFIAFFFSQNANAQVSGCGTDIRHQEMMNSSPEYKQYMDYMEQNHERLMDEWLNDPQYASWRVGNLLTIPVVFHILHVGELEGTGTNISDTEIFDGLRELNEKYQNLNAKGIDIEIDFCLAKRDPLGNPTEGIVRVDCKDVPNYEMDGMKYNNSPLGASEAVLKGRSKWNNQLYYNIWVINKIQGGWAGFAYFPSPNNTLDGMVITYDNLTGNVLAHEIGHALNLKHTFEGDNNGMTCPKNLNCKVDGDAICDTPPHKVGDCGSSNPCTIAGIWDNSRLNYMSYCGGADRFTPNQKDRMRLALNNPRKSLITSEACLSTNIPNDIGIIRVLYPNDAPLCSDVVSAKVLIKNYGKNDLVAARIEVELDGVKIDTFNFSAQAGTIPQNDTATIIFDPVTVTSGTHLMKFVVLGVNFAADEYNKNDYGETTFSYIGLSSSSNFCIDFNNGKLYDDLKLYTFSDFVPDTARVVDCSNNPNNIALAFKSRNTPYIDTTTTDLYFKTIDLSNTKYAQVSFDISMRQDHLCSSWASLAVEVSKDCGVSWTTLYYKNDVPPPCNPFDSQPNFPPITVKKLFTKSINFLDPPPTDEFFPSSCADWRTDTVNLSAFAGSSVQIRFRVVMDSTGGENLYLDNFCVYTCNVDSRFTKNGTQTVCFGELPNLQLQGSDAPGLTYVWTKDGAVIPGATTSSYNANFLGTYQLKTSNGSCTVTSEAVEVKRQDSCKYSPTSSCLEEQFKNPKGRFDVHFTNHEFGYICSDVGVIFKSKMNYKFDTKSFESNNDLEQMSTNTINNLYGVHVVDTSFGIAVGEKGTVLLLKEDSWSALNTPITENLNDINFGDNTNGWIVGDKGSLFKITKSLNLSSFVVGTENLNGVHFFNTNNGWIVGNNGASYKTINGGTNWTKNTTPVLNWRAVYFVSVDTGWIVSDLDVAYKTVNGGTNWTLQAQGIQASLREHLLAQPKTPSALVAKKFYLNFGGSTIQTFGTDKIKFNQYVGFDRSTNPKLMEMNGSMYYDEENLTCASRLDFSSPALQPLISLDVEPAAVLVAVQDIVFTDANRGYAVGSPGLFMTTTDGGLTWNKQTFITSLLKLNAIKFFDTQTGLIVGNLGTIFKTTNGGNTWGLVEINGSYELRDVDGSSENYVWAVGTIGVLKYSKDGGSNWNTKQLQPFEDLNCISNPVDSVAFIGVNNGYIYRHTGANIWFLSRFNSRLDIKDISIVNKTFGFLVGKNEAYRTLDGGNNWVPMFGIWGFELDAVKFVSRDTGWVAGSKGTGKGRIFKTTNLGENWALLNPGNTYPMRSLYINRQRDGWAAGNQFNIIKIDKPSASSRADTICAGQEFTLGKGKYTSTGIYRDTFGNALGCDSVVTINLYVRPNLTLKTSNVTSLCTGDTVNIFLPANQQLPKTTYTWFYNGTVIPNQTASTITARLEGAYTLKINHANCSVGTDTILIDTIPLPKPKILGSPFTCQGKFTILEIEDIYPNFTWSTGKKTLQIAVNTPGKYSITVTDQTGCEGVDSVNVEVGATPVPVITGLKTICQGVPTQLDAGSFVKYLWSTSDSTQNITVSVTGTYSVTVTNSFGCTGVSQVEIVDGGTPDPDIAGSTTFCEGKSTELDAINGPFATYKWTGGSTSQKLTITKPGTYGVTVTSAQGCIGIDSLEINTLPSPQPTLGDTIKLCDGKSATLTPGPGFNTYLWSTGENTEKITVNTSELFSVTVTNDFGCDAADTVAVVVGFKPNPSISGILAICEGNQTTLTASAGFVSYEWSNTKTDPSILVTTGGTYTVTVTDAGGCSGTQSVVVKESPSPKPAITGNLNICEGANTNLDAGSGFTTYTWSNGIKTQVLPVSTGGQYTVTVSNSAGCTGTSQVVVNAISSPQPDISGILLFCKGDNATLDAGAGFNTYAWTGGTVTQTLTVTNSGIYIVTVTNSNNCKGYDTVSVTAQPLPNPNITGVLGICEGDPTTLKADTGFVSYIWTGASTGTTLTVTTGGVYGVTVEDALGCKGASSVTVNESPRPKPAISGNLNICDGAKSDLNAGLGFSTYLWSTGSKTQFAPITTGGEYTVTVTNSSGCSGTDKVVVSAIPSPKPDISGTLKICQGSSTTLDAGLGFDSYSWTGGSTNQTLTVTTSGAYIVAVTNSNNCQGFDTVNVVVQALPTPTIKGLLGICAGQTTVLTADTGYISYIWTGAVSGNKLTIDKGGIYSITVSDALGCTGSNSVTVTEAANPKPAITGLSSFCEGTNSTLNAGNGFTTYTWSDGKNTAQNIVTSSGLFVVTVTNAAGCSGKDSLQVTTIPAPDPKISGALKFCAGKSTDLDAGANFSTYKWSTGGTTKTINVPLAGVYSLTVSNASGCVGFDTVTVTISSNPSPVITGPLSLCAGDTAKLAVANFVSYQWSNSATTPTINVLASGTYTVTVTNAEGCSGTDDIAVNFIAKPTPQITGNLSICEGAATLLDAGTGFSSYKWSDGQTAQVIQVTKGATYTVTVTNASGCVGTANVVVQETSNPKPVIQGSLAFCKGASADLSLTAAFDKYVWSNGPTTAAVKVSSGGVYTVTVTNAGNCTGTAQVTVVENALPTPTISGNLKICEGETTTLTANTGYLGYSWSTNVVTESIIVTTSGKYTVTVTDNNTCRNTAQVDVVVNQAPKPSISGNLGICDGNSTTLSGTAGFQAYAWSTGGNSANIQVTQAGTYTLTVTDNNGCKGTVAASVKVSVAPQVAITGNPIFCEGLSSVLSAGAGFKSYLWSNGSNLPTITVTNAGLYSVTVTNDAGCSGKSDLLTSTISKPTSKIISDVLDVCPGDTILLEGIGGETFKWITDNGQFGNPDTSSTYLVTGKSANVLLVTTNLCGTDTSKTDFNVLSATGEAGPDVTILKGSSVTLSAKGGGSYQWISPFTLSCKGCSKPTLSPTESTDIIVIITDKNGCKTKDTIKITVEENIEDVVEVVNTITPNGDGKNDKLILKGVENFKTNSLTIYNRWGDIVYNTKGYDNLTNIFDGTKDGALLPAGAYYYVLKVLDTGKEFKSVLVIVRD